MASDEELVGRIARGDEPALEELLGRYSGSLAHIIERHTGGLDVECPLLSTTLNVFGSKVGA